jgi:hypothetical protein
MRQKLPLQKVSWSDASGYVKVLDAHLFEVGHRRFWELDENDHLKLP